MAVGTVASVAPVGAAKVLLPKPPGDQFCYLLQYTGSSSYVTNGDALLALIAPIFPINLIEHVVVEGVLPNANSVVNAAYNYSTGKLQLMQTTGAEVSSTTNVSGTVVNLSVWGH